MKRNKLIINLSLTLSMLFCLAFACNNGDEHSRSESETDKTQAGSTTSTTNEKRPPTEQEVKETFIRTFGDSDTKFESIQNKSTVKSYTSNLGVYVHGYPVNISSVTAAGYGVKNGTRAGGTYYFYTDDFGEWQLFQDSITRTDF